MVLAEEDYVKNASEWATVRQTPPPPPPPRPPPPPVETKKQWRFVCWLVAYRPSNMRVYLRDGSAQTILRAATLR